MLTSSMEKQGKTEMKVENFDHSWQIEAWKTLSQGVSLILADGTGRILWTNHNDEDQIGIASYLQAILSAGEIPQQWREAILTAASQARCDGDRIVLLEKLDKSERFLAKFMCFEVNSQRIFGLKVPGPVKLSQSERDDLARATDMSPTEIKVVCLTLNGQTINDISSELGIAVETARTHMRRIYCKLGVGSREALFSAVAILV
jgi:DNA-binding CsgD family transcriptional regulator